MDDKVGIYTARLAVLLTPYVAEIMSDVFAATGLVVTVNVAARAPAETVTLPGVCAAAVLLLESTTLGPPVGAGSVSVTVAVELFPPVTLAGFSVTEVTVGGLIVRTPVFCARSFP